MVTRVPVLSQTSHLRRVVHGVSQTKVSITCRDLVPQPYEFYTVPPHAHPL